MKNQLDVYKAKQVVASDAEEFKSFIPKGEVDGFTWQDYADLCNKSEDDNEEFFCFYDHGYQNSYLSVSPLRAEVLALEPFIISKRFLNCQFGPYCIVHTVWTVYYGRIMKYKLCLRNL